jgi:hypothetical protein
MYTFPGKVAAALGKISKEYVKAHFSSHTHCAMLHMSFTLPREVMHSPCPTTRCRGAQGFPLQNCCRSETGCSRSLVLWRGCRPSCWPARAIIPVKWQGAIFT